MPWCTQWRSEENHEWWSLPSNLLETVVSLSVPLWPALTRLDNIITKELTLSGEYHEIGVQTVKKARFQGLVCQSVEGAREASKT